MGKARDDDRLVRAVTLPVGVPVGRSWAELDAALADAWRLSTAAARWVAKTLYRRDDDDSLATPVAVKMGKTSDGQFSAYSEAATCTRCALQWYRGEAPRNPVTRQKPPQCRCPGEPTTRMPGVASGWEGAKQSLGCCLRSAHRTYLRTRPDMVRRGRPPGNEFGYPFPFPVHAGAWAVAYGRRFENPDYDSSRKKSRENSRLVWRETGRATDWPTVTLTLPGHGSFTLRLKRRRDFGRQLAMFRQLHEGTATKGEAALSRNRKGDVLVKLVGRFPRRPPDAPPEHACLLRTDPAAFLVAEVDGRKPWVLNCDHLRRWSARHKAYLQRAAEDAKREKRMDRRQRAYLNTARELRCEKQYRRVTTALGQLTAQVVRFCERQRVGCVVFDDSVRAYLPDGFPWFAFGAKLRYKLDGAGVPLVAHDSPEPQEVAAWLADRSLVGAMALAGLRLVAGARRKGAHPAVTSSTRRPSAPTSSPPRGSKSASTSRSPSPPPARRSTPSARAD